MCLSFNVISFREGHCEVYTQQSIHIREGDHLLYLITFYFEVT